MLTRLPKAMIRTRVELPLRFSDGYAADARVFTFDGLVDGREHLAFALGDRTAPIPRTNAASALIRPHSECLTGDVFGSQRCDCGPQLREAVERISSAGGYLLYLRQEGRAWALLEARCVRAAGRRCRHVRGQPRAWPRRGRAQLRRRGADAARARRVPGRNTSATTPTRPGSSRLRRDRRRAGADGRVRVSREPPLPGNEGAPRRAHARSPERAQVAFNDTRAVAPGGAALP